MNNCLTTNIKQPRGCTTTGWKVFLPFPKYVLNLIGKEGLLKEVVEIKFLHTHGIQ